MIVSWGCVVDKCEARGDHAHRLRHRRRTRSCRRELVAIDPSGGPVVSCGCLARPDQSALAFDEHWAEDLADGVLVR
jgi:hypothetical protein